MADTILYSQAELENLVSRLQGVQHALEGVRGQLAGVDTSGKAGGDLDVSGVSGMVSLHVLGGIIGGSTVRERVHAYGRRVDDYADYVGRLTRAVRRVGAEFEQVEGKLRSDSKGEAVIGNRGPLAGILFPPTIGPRIPGVIAPLDPGLLERIQDILFGPRLRLIGALPGLVVSGAAAIAGWALPDLLASVWGDTFVTNPDGKGGAVARGGFTIPGIGTVVEGEVLGWSANSKVVGSWSRKGSMSSDETSEPVGIEASIEGEGHLAKVSATTQLGPITDTRAWKVGNVSGSGSLGLTLMKNGELALNLEGKAKGSVSVASAERTTKLGNDDVNVFVKGDGSVLGAGGEVGFQAGMSGVEAGVGGEAYVAKGSVGGGIEILGIKIGVNGEVMAGVNATAKVKVGAESEGQVGLGPFKVKVSVDMSGFLSDVKGKVGKVRSFLGLA